MKVEMPYIDNETIRITKHGQWLSNGEPIAHEATVRGYSRHLGRDDEGWYIEIGPDFKRIEVEDTAYFVTAILPDDDGYSIRLSDGTLERLDLTTLAYSPGRLTARIKSGKEEARFLAQPYHELLMAAQEDASGYYFEVQGDRVELAPKEAP